MRQISSAKALVVNHKGSRLRWSVEVILQIDGYLVPWDLETSPIN